MLLDEKEAYNFLNNEDFKEKNEFKRFGITLDLMFNDYKHYIGTYLDKKLICITLMKQIGDTVVEVHTYVLPEHKELSVEILKSHTDLAKSLGITLLITYATPVVKNFLAKRLGYKVIRKVEDYYKMYVSLYK